MKKTYAFALATGLLLMGSCASDAPEINSGNDVDTSGLGYIRFGFTHDETTRAEQATITEDVVINTVDFLFYNESGSYLGDTRVVANQADDNATWLSTKHDNMDLCVAIKIPYTAASRVTVVINKAGVGDLDENNQIATVPLGKDEYKDSKNGYVMSNAVQYGSGNTGTVEENVATWRVKLDKTKVYQSMDAAKAPNAEAAAVVNVERTVSRMSIVAKTGLLDAEGKVTIASSKFSTAGEEKENESDPDIEYTIDFKPTYAYITNTRPKGALIKQLPEWSTLGSFLQGKQNEYAGRSTVAAALSGSDNTRQTYNLTSLKTFADAKKLFTNNLTYLYDTYGTNSATTRTAPSLAVVGEYTVKKNGTAIAGVGTDNETFYLVGVGDLWKICLTLDDALKAMGATSSKSLKKQVKGTNRLWTGYMVLENEETPIPCLMYDKGMGYYTRAVERYSNTVGETTTVYSYLVRNTAYELSVDGISGMGVGLPDETTTIEPIDPPTPNDNSFYLHVSINVYPWIPLPVQSVTW